MADERKPSVGLDDGANVDGDQLEDLLDALARCRRCGKGVAECRCRAIVEAVESD